jgi:hypothetical protein
VGEGGGRGGNDEKCERKKKGEPSKIFFNGKQKGNRVANVIKKDR